MKKAEIQELNRRFNKNYRYSLVLRSAVKKLIKEKDFDSLFKLDFADIASKRIDKPSLTEYFNQVIKSKNGEKMYNLATAIEFTHPEFLSDLIEASKTCNHLSFAFSMLLDLQSMSLKQAKDILEKIVYVSFDNLFDWVQTMEYVAQSILLDSPDIWDDDEKVSLIQYFVYHLTAKGEFYVAQIIRDLKQKKAYFKDHPDIAHPDTGNLCPELLTFIDILKIASKKAFNYTVE